MPKAIRPLAALNSQRTEGKCSLAEQSFGTKSSENSQPRLATYVVDRELVVHPQVWSSPTRGWFMTTARNKITRAEWAALDRRREQAQSKASRLRTEGCAPPVTRLVQQVDSAGTAHVIDTVLAIVPAPPGWRVAFASKDHKTGLYVDPDYDPILGFAIGLERRWPITFSHSAEEIATAEDWLWQSAVVRPDGCVDWEREEFSSVERWIEYLNQLEAEKVAA